MSDTPGMGCGIYPVLIRRTKFVDACDWHDLAYLKESWHQGHITRKQVDNWFLTQMLLKAGDSRILRAQAYLFYRIARLFGGLWWEGRGAGLLELIFFINFLMGCCIILAGLCWLIEWVCS